MVWTPSLEGFSSPVSVPLSTYAQRAPFRQSTFVLARASRPLSLPPSSSRLTPTSASSLLLFTLTSLKWLELDPHHGTIVISLSGCFGDGGHLPDHPLIAILEQLVTCTFAHTRGCLFLRHGVMMKKPVLRLPRLLPQSSS
jgi:hypothetical protein